MLNEMDGRRRFLQLGAVFGAISIFESFLGTQVRGDDVKNPLPPPPEPSTTKWTTSIVPAGEPGDLLVVSGCVFAPDGVRSVAGVVVYAYNTDRKGYYSRDGKVGHPRLKGYMKTNAEGLFELHTIVPGRYPDMRIPAHVHFNMWGAGFPVQWTDDLRFEGDSYLTEAMKKESAALGKFATIRPVIVDSTGVRHCEINLRLLDKSNFQAP
jgi:protocatechuate 3,4-dioxygenase beta subunit